MAKLGMLAATNARMDSLEAKFQEREQFDAYVAGQNMTALTALLALISASPRPDLLEPVLRSHLTLLVQGYPNGSERFKGAGEIRDVLLLACKEAIEFANCEHQARH